MNLVSIMNKAWSYRQEFSIERLTDISRNLISHAYVDYLNVYQNKGYKANIPYFAYNNILISLMGTDGDYLQGEYDSYSKTCNYMGFAPFSVDKVKETYRNLTVDNISKNIQALTNYRHEISSDHYQAMVLGFCTFCLLGDRAFDENEYYIIRCFFDDGYDYCPSTWQQFKREWK